MGQVKGMRLRVAAMSVIFDKVLRVPLKDLPTTTPGRLINICSNDVEYIQDGMKHIPPALLAPFEVCRERKRLFIPSSFFFCLPVKRAFYSQSSFFGSFVSQSSFF